MPQLDRRTFLRGSAATAGAVMLGGPFQGFVARAANAATRTPSFPLGPVEDMRDGIVRLWLPKGFHYRSFHDTETPVTLPDGTALPGRHDGMAAFPGPGENVLLVRNHEVNGTGAPFGPGTPYDSAARGGTTTIEVTPKGKVVDAYTSLNGTQMNCSGGPMPWGSWITCEETINGPDVGPDFTGVSNVPLQQRHGFIFDVPAGGQSTREPITAAGRFAHESVAFDPIDGILYLTEDNFGFPSGFYRYIPASNPMESGFLDNEGQLQMLAVAGQPNLDLAVTQAQGATYDVGWVDIDDPAPSFPYTPWLHRTHDERSGDRVRREPGPSAGSGVLLASRGIRVRGRRRLFHCDAGRGARGDEHRTDRRRLRERERAGLGVQHTGRDPAVRVPVPRCRGPGLPGQRDDQPTGNADPVRGQHRATTTCAGSRRRGSCSTLRSTASSAGPAHRGSETSSPDPRSAPTAPRSS